MFEQKLQIIELCTASYTSLNYEFIEMNPRFIRNRIELIDSVIIQLYMYKKTINKDYYYVYWEQLKYQFGFVINSYQLQIFDNSE